MKLKDIYKDKLTKIFRVVNQNSENELDFEIEPTQFESIPDIEGYFIIRAFEVREDKTTECFMDMSTTERISEIVIRKGFLGKLKIIEYYNYIDIVIPAVASDCFGNYELYYSKENPQIGIEVLKKGLEKSKKKQIVYEDLGYILRDENKNEEAIEAFNKSVEYGPTTPYSYLELSHLFEKLGDSNLKDEYFKKFIENGGETINFS